MPMDPSDLGRTPASEARLLGAIEQVRASLAARSWLLAGLAETLHALDQERNPGRLAALIAEQLCQRANCRHVGVLALGPDAAQITAEAGAPEGGAGWLQLAREVAASGSDAAAGDERFAIPLLRSDRPLGALAVTGGGGPISGIDRQALVAFADAAALALDSAFAFARLEEDARRIEHTEALLAEMHHRIKGNLQRVADLLSTQRRHERSPLARRALDTATGRIKSIAVVHDLLSRDLRGVTDSRELIERLMATVRAAIADDSEVRLTWHADAICLRSRQASALGLIAHELVSNALRHGRKEGENRVTVSLVANEGRAVLCVRDYGEGLPSSFHFERDAGAGLRLIKVLTERELSGELALRNANGLSATVTFQVTPEGDRR